MIEILKFIPQGLWWLLLVAGLSGYFLSHLIPIKTYQLPLKISGLVVVALMIFVQGVLYADHTWQQAAKELQAQVKVAEAKSQTVNEVIRERVVTRTKVVKEQGASIVQYIERKTDKLDQACVIPKEFVSAHNQAAEPAK